MSADWAFWVHDDRDSKETASKQDLMDYKCFTFSGRVEFIQVDYDRFTNHRRTLYSRDWEKLPFVTQYPTDPNRVIKRPRRLDDMIKAAEHLAQEAGSPAHVRIDFYTDDVMLKFGEMTFYHGAGFARFEPPEWDEKVGELVDLGRTYGRTCKQF